MNHPLFNKNMYFARETLKHVKTMFHLGSTNHDNQATLTERKIDTVLRNRNLADREVILRWGKLGSMSKSEAYTLFATLRGEQ